MKGYFKIRSQAVRPRLQRPQRSRAATECTDQDGTLISADEKTIRASTIRRSPRALIGRFISGLAKISVSNASSCAPLRIAFLALAFALPLRAAPLLEKIELFEGEKDGYKVYRIPGLIVTARGVVLATCEARLTGNGDWDQIDIMLRRSLDGGRTWEPRRKIADVPGPKPKNPVSLRLKKIDTKLVTYDNATMIADRDGAVHVLFCLEYSRCFYLRSDDDGATFSKPVEITSTFEQFRRDYDWKVLATGPGHSIQLRNGRLVVPVWLSKGTGEGAHRPSVTTVVYSDDHGKTWQRGDIAVPDTVDWVYPNETVAVELADGRVMFNVRTESPTHRRLVTTSPDGATHWSLPAFDAQLLEPICMAGLVRVSTVANGGRNRLLFSNPDTLAPRGKEPAVPGKMRDRKNLSLKLSYDEGLTWPVNKVLEPGSSSYSDLAVLKDGTILCFYERRGESADPKVVRRVMTVARFNLEWLTDGRDSFGATR